MATETSDPVRLPPGPRWPKLVQGAVVLTLRYQSIEALGRKFGPSFTLRLPALGDAVVVSDPTLVKDLFSTSRDLIGRPKQNLGKEVLGEGSIFNLEGEELQARRKILLPPFHGKSMRTYERITEEEVRKEIAGWPEGVEFETVEPMTRITLNTILRAIFGAEGPALDQLRVLIPAAVEFGSRLALAPTVVKKDFGKWSPGGRFKQFKQQVDDVIFALMAEARSDPNFENRADVLSLLLQARNENGEPLSDRHIADELLTELVAGHETTSTQLSWAIERLRRHPDVLARLTAEVDEGAGNEYLLAVLSEVQRTRPVLTAALRRTKKRIRLGEWVIPEDTIVMASTQLAMTREASFPDAKTFDPDRFVGQTPSPFAWIPFGGGMMRCIGASFATMEMEITLRTILQEFRIEPTTAPDERIHTRGVTVAPGRGGLLMVRRRNDRRAAAEVTDVAAEPDHSTA
ncbi:cytochrome P450 [Mycolicibacterium vaccae]|uniref:cytochrome P450 n=1 Tax=Mycolicibacterium vaccae TaxID=1810 RepID=UPI003CEEF578